MTRSGEYLLGPLRQALKKYALSEHYLDGLTLVTAMLGDEVGLTGALVLARELNTESYSPKSTKMTKTP